MFTYMPDSVYLTVSDRTIDETDRSDSMTGTMRKTKKRKKNNYCTDQIVTQWNNKECCAPIMIPCYHDNLDKELYTLTAIPEPKINI